MTGPKSVLETNLERLFARAYAPIEARPEFRARLLREIRNRPQVAPRSRFSGSPWPLRVAAAAAIALAAGIVLWRSSVHPVPGVNGNLAGDPAPAVPTPEPRRLPVDEVPPGAGRGDAVADRELDSATAADPGRIGAAAPGDAVAPPSPAPAPESSVLRGRVSASPLDHAGADASRPQAPESPESIGTYVVTLLRTERLPLVSRPEPHEFSGGAFAIEHLRAGTYWVFVRAPGFATWERGGVEVGSGGDGVDLDVVLDRGASVHGRVLDADGQPVGGAMILSERDTPAQLLPLSTEGSDLASAASTTSLADGSFEFGPLSRGVQRLRATRAGHGAVWSDPIDLTREATAEVVLRLVRPGAIEGQVARDDGSPWPEAFVVASWMDVSGGFLERQCLHYGHAVADSTGHYEIADLPPGLFVVLNVLEGRDGRVPRVQQVRVEAGRRARADLPGGERGTSVEGTFLAGDGKPLGGRDVTFLPAQDPGTSWKSTRTRDDGRFDFPSLAPGTYLVYAGGNYGTEIAYQTEVEVPVAPVFRTVVRAGSGSLRGRVTAAETGHGLSSAVLVLERQQDRGPKFAGRIVADAEGRYALALLQAGKYRITAYSVVGLFGQETADDVEIGDGAEATTLDFALRPGAAMSIHVRDEGGRPIEGARIGFVAPGGFAVAFSPEDRTDAQGALAVRGAKPGRWSLRVERAGFEPSETVLDLAVGEDRTVEIRLRPVVR